MQIKENTSIHPGKISLGVGRYAYTKLKNENPHEKLNPQLGQEHVILYICKKRKKKRKKSNLQFLIDLLVTPTGYALTNSRSVGFDLDFQSPSNSLMRAAASSVGGWENGAALGRATELRNFVSGGKSTSCISRVIALFLLVPLEAALSCPLMIPFCFETLLNNYNSLPLFHCH